MVVVAVAFVIGGILGAVLTAGLISRAQRSLAFPSPDLAQPTHPAAEHWLGERDASRPYPPDERIERFEHELAKRLGREAAATARERRAAAYRALRPRFGVTIRVRE